MALITIPELDRICDLEGARTLPFPDGPLRANSLTNDLTQKRARGIMTFLSQLIFSVGLTLFVIQLFN